MPPRCVTSAPGPELAEEARELRGREDRGRRQPQAVGVRVAGAVLAQEACEVRRRKDQRARASVAVRIAHHRHLGLANHHLRGVGRVARVVPRRADEPRVIPDPAFGTQRQDFREEVHAVAIGTERLEGR